MSNAAELPRREIKKRQVTETVLFAINHIPTVDQVTLKRFLELVNATGTFGDMTEEQIINKMRLTLKYIPNACPRSLLVLADLLEIPVSTPLPTNGQPAVLPPHYPVPQVELNRGMADHPRLSAK